MEREIEREVFQMDLVWLSEVSAEVQVSKPLSPALTGSWARNEEARTGTCYPYGIPESQVMA